MIRIRNIPERKEYSSIVFPDFESGIGFMWDVAKTRQWPASIRLVDNVQFQFAQALRPAHDTLKQEIIERLKRFLLVYVKGFDINKISAVTLNYEGSNSEVDGQIAVINKLT